MKDAHDKLKGYCKVLGHFNSFKYCRNINKNLPCYEIYNCWFEKFDIESFITENYSKEEISLIHNPPKPKIVSILEIIKKVKNKA